MDAYDSNGKKLYMYRVKVKFETPDGVTWPVGAIRYWTQEDYEAFSSKAEFTGFLLSQWIERVEFR